MNLLANSRSNVSIGDAFPVSNGRRFGVIVESLGTTPAQIVVERAMSSNAGGVLWSAGTAAVELGWRHSRGCSETVTDKLLHRLVHFLVGRTSRACALLTLALLFACARPARATTVLYRTDGELVALSERVVRARVLSTTSEATASGVVTVTRLDILEDFTGIGTGVLKKSESPADRPEAAAIGCQGRPSSS